MADLEQRLIAIELITNPGQPFSIQSVKPWLERNSALRKEASAEITRLRAALADAQAVGFAAWVEAAAKYIDRRVSNYVDEHGIFDGETGVTEFPGNGEEWVWDQEETAEAIRALAPPDATAAAARVLLDDLAKSHTDHPDAHDRWQRINAAMGGSVGPWLVFIDALSVIAGDTP